MHVWLKASVWVADNVLAFDVVNTWEYNTTGKLEVVSVSADSYPDLFWGLRVSRTSVISTA